MGRLSRAALGRLAAPVVASILMGAPGCYRSHERATTDGSPDAGLDARRVPRDAQPDDARPGDAGPPELTTCNVTRDEGSPGLVWATTLVRSFEDMGSAELPEIQALPSGGVIVATAAQGRAVILRETNERLPGDAFCVVARFDASGELVWRRELERCDVIDLGVAPDESVCVLGRFADGAEFGASRLSGEGMYVLSLDADGEPRFVSSVRGSGGDALDVACDEGTVAMGAGREADLLIDDRVVLGPSTTGGFVATWERDGSLRWVRSVEGVAAAVAIDESGDVWVAQHGLPGRDGAPGRVEARSRDLGDPLSSIDLRARQLDVMPALFFDEIEITPRGMWLTGRFRGELALPGGRTASVLGAIDGGFVARLARDGTGLGLATTRSASSPLYLNLSSLGDDAAIVAGAFRGDGDFAGLAGSATIGTDVFALAVRADGSAAWVRTFADLPSTRAADYVADDFRWRAPADVSARSPDEIYVAGRFLSRIELGDCVLTGEEMNSFLARLAER